MDEIRDGSTNGDGQAECPESSPERVTEDPGVSPTGVEAGDDTTSPGVVGESIERRQQLEKVKRELRRAYWKRWYDEGGAEKVKASRDRKKGS